MKKFALPTIILLACILRLFALFHYGDFWSDEMFSFTYAQKPWLESMTHFWVWETNPPLYTLLLKIWLYIVPATELYTRLLSVLTGTITIYLLYRLLKPTGERTALLAAFFLALSPYHIFLSATVRGYALLLCIAVLTSLWFENIFFKENKKCWWVYTITTALLLYIHYTAWSLVIAQGVVIFATKKHVFKKWCSIIAPAGLSWLVWAIPSILSKTHDSGFTTAWYFNLDGGIKAIAISLEPLLTTYTWWILPPLILIAILLLSVTRYRTIMIKEERHILTLLIVESFIPLAFAALLGVWNIKFFIIALPFIVSLVAHLISNTARWYSVGIIGVLAFTIPGIYHLLTYNLPLENWSTVAHYINQPASSTPLLIYNNFVYKNQFDRYYHGTVPLLAYTASTTKDWDKVLITQNYLRSSPTTVELDAWYDTHNIETYRDVFVMIDTSVDIPLTNLLERHGYTKIDGPYYPRLVIASPLYHYVRSENTH